MSIQTFSFQEFNVSLREYQEPTRSGSLSLPPYFRAGFFN